MLAMAGCSHMPVTSMVKLARVDFETSDPAQLRAAIKLPRTLRPQPNGVTLRLAVQVGRAPGKHATSCCANCPNLRS